VNDYTPPFFYTLSLSLQKDNGTDLLSIDKPGIEMNVSFWMVSARQTEWSNGRFWLRFNRWINI